MYRSSSRHTYGTCLWPDSTTWTPRSTSSSRRSPASVTVLRSRPVPGTGIRWWWSANTFSPLPPRKFSRIHS